jgi:GDP/UDP-N,N'-diacetylbacillosamine 2-epimerase (hydrolysing)
VKKICIVTGTRAEYGLLKWLMKDLQESSEFTLQLVATGTHLSPEFGLTYREIENDGFQIDCKVEMLLSSDTASGTARSMGLAVMGLGDALDRLKPDMLLVLGDRYEILAAVSAALVLRIPVAHVHGGEITEGAFDDAIRHAITKMSHLHFVAAEEFRARVIQMGEQPDRVFTVGGLGVDGISRLQLLSREELEKSLDFALGSRSLIVTFHPATLDQGSPEHQTAELLAALDNLKDTSIIFTLPNADPGSRAMAALIHDFVSSRPHAKAFASLGQLRYFSCLKHVDGIVGNSSSGLLEAPSFQKGTVNIGIRQRGRTRAGSVIDCEPNRASIGAALKRLFSPEFQAGLAQVINPYGDGNASRKIADTLARVAPGNILVKRFHDAGTSP